jgi:hypothetical protein
VHARLSYRAGAVALPRSSDRPAMPELCLRSQKPHCATPLTLVCPRKIEVLLFPSHDTMSLSHVCSLCRRKLSETCPEDLCARNAENASCPLATGVCGHLFHFHCVCTVLKRAEVCPVDGTPWDFSRIEDRFDLAAPDPKNQACHDAHPELYHLINRYRLIRCAGHFDPVSYGLLIDIRNHLVMMGHPSAEVFGKCIRRLPEGGMMISFDDWEWLFRFLDKLAVSVLDVKDMGLAGFEEPPLWMREPDINPEGPK